MAKSMYVNVDRDQLQIAKSCILSIMDAVKRGEKKTINGTRVLQIPSHYQATIEAYGKEALDIISEFE